MLGYNYNREPDKPTTIFTPQQHHDDNESKDVTRRLTTIIFSRFHYLSTTEMMMKMKLL
jgi:hypothetical protein